MRSLKGIIAAGLVCTCVLSLTGCGRDLDAERKALNEQVLSQTQEGDEQAEEVKPAYNPYADEETSFDASHWLAHVEGRDYGSQEPFTYQSKLTGTERIALVMFPPNYDPNKKYPVAYLLHGKGCAYTSWSDLGGDTILANGIAEGVMEPMILIGTDNEVVMPGEDVNRENIVWENEAYRRFLDDLTGSLMPYVESHYPVKTGRDNTAIAGFSYGGKLAMYIAFKRPDLFGSAGGIGTTAGLTEKTKAKLIPDFDTFRLDEKVGQFKYLMVTTGKKDSEAGKVSEQIDEELTDQGIAHLYYRGPGAHGTEIWQDGIYNFCKRLFH